MSSEGGRFESMAFGSIVTTLPNIIRRHEITYEAVLHSRMRVHPTSRPRVSLAITSVLRSFVTRIIARLLVPCESTVRPLAQ